MPEGHPFPALLSTRPGGCIINSKVSPDQGEDMAEMPDRRLMASRISLAAQRSTNGYLPLTKTLTGPLPARFPTLTCPDQAKIGLGFEHPVSLAPSSPPGTRTALTAFFPPDWTSSSDSGRIYSEPDVLLWLLPKADSETKPWAKVACLGDHLRQQRKGVGKGGKRGRKV